MRKEKVGKRNRIEGKRREKKNQGKKEKIEMREVKK